MGVKITARTNLYIYIINNIKVKYKSSLGFGQDAK